MSEVFCVRKDASGSWSWLNHSSKKLIRQRKHLLQLNNQKVVDTSLMGLYHSDFTRRASRRPTPPRRRECFSILWESDTWQWVFDFGIKDEDVIRLSNVNVAWCLCGHCVTMSKHIESLCCREIAGVHHRMPDSADRDACMNHDWPRRRHRAVLGIDV